MSRTLLLVRHAETRYNVRGLLSGDPRDTRCVLTRHGRQQARNLGRTLSRERIDLCVTSTLLRARETADLVLTERADIPRIERADLNDPRAGDFEGKPLSSLLEWMSTNGGLAATPPGGGEGFNAAAHRWWRAYEWLIGRPDENILVVTHAAPIAVLLNAIEGRPPEAHRDVANAVPHRVAVKDAASALGAARDIARPS